MATWQPTRAVALRIATLALAGGVAVGLAGCSTESKVEVTKTNLANTLKTQINQNGTAANQVKCKDALDGKVGATQVCAVKVNGQWYTANITATSIDGKEVNFNYKVDPQPTTAPTY
ncbi:DUF4333 domain-containing protein [Jongsikchunia kroppenstedtii]|uniref:DUF4333 domain-containing protein n=1 Tax=Jongsikchunia kroppenstedtii TaxID=1121721 RepID=UPI000376E9C0|nr:DUF4333 domain-containing protein [Jongsikchunia kroppenstedtii]